VDYNLLSRGTNPLFKKAHEECLKMSPEGVSNIGAVYRSLAVPELLPGNIFYTGHPGA